VVRNIVWSRTECSFCDQVKNLLEMKGIEFEERKIGDGWTREDLLEMVPNARTVPQIFLNGNLIGGFNELQKYLEETISDYGDSII
jgi:glutaredoxin